MAVLAGSDVAVRVSDDSGSSWEPVEGINSFDLSRDPGEIDVSTLGTAAPKRLLGLRDASVDISGFLDLSDDGQNIIRAAYDSGDDVRISWAWDGSNYQFFDGVVTALDESTTPDGAVEFSCTIATNGTLIAT